MQKSPVFKKTFLSRYNLHGFMTERTFKLRAKVFAFCNGKENKTACILCEVRFLKKSRSSSFTNRILLDVMCSTEALLEVIRCRCKTWNCKFCALRRVLEFKQKNKTFLKPINIYHCLFEATLN